MVIFITGISSGFGLETAKLLAAKGHKVYGAARRVEKIKPLGEFGVTAIRMDITDEQREFLLGAEYIYGALDFHVYFKESEKLLKELKANGVKLFFDCESSFESDFARKMIPYGTVLSFNEFSADLYSGGRPFEEFKDGLFESGVKAIILTLAENGAKIITPEGEWSVPCHKVVPVDTTGAGDTFNASFVAAQMMGYDYEHSLIFANAAANMSVTVQGPRGGITTAEKVEEFIRECPYRS